jgi:starvation-inducible outer membrane lipoprotein
MKRTVLFLLALTLATSALQAGTKTYGAGIKEAETTSVAKIMANPDAYVGKTVRIEGKVVDVCPMKGCWMELEEQGGKSRLRVQVDDGVIVFPVDSKGKSAVAEGIVESIPMSRERYVAWLEHLAEEKGEKFDPSTVGEGPYSIFHIRATGAKVEE